LRKFFNKDKDSVLISLSESIVVHSMSGRLRVFSTKVNRARAGLGPHGKWYTILRGGKGSGARFVEILVREKGQVDMKVYYTDTLHLDRGWVVSHNRD